MKFSLEQLTEGIRQRNLGSANQAVVDKWERTSLLEGLRDVHKENMARLLENQAAQVLREHSSLSTGGGALGASGDLRGFTNVAFPIVRRVFGGLVANELVSIQPMSLPSGLLFYLDYTRGSNVGDGYKEGDSIYNSPTGKDIRRGSDAVGGLYDLAGQSYTKVHHSTEDADLSSDVAATGTYTEDTDALTDAAIDADHLRGRAGRLLQFDPQITGDIEAGVDWSFVMVSAANLANLDVTQIKEVALVGKDPAVPPAGLELVGNDHLGRPIQQGSTLLNVKRLTQLGRMVGGKFISDPFAEVTNPDTAVLFVVKGKLVDPDPGATPPEVGGYVDLKLSYPVGDTLDQNGDATTLVIPTFESDFAVDPSPEIPEIDIKVEAVPVVATTRKLRARWSPELAQDLNAYHSLDAEVELTQILSEQIALEIDREILNDLLTQGTAANFFWSRAPGKFVDKESGRAIADSMDTTGPMFRGTVREWYETLAETIIDVANQIHRKTLRGAANFIVVGPDVATILEASVLYKPNYTLDGQGQVSGMTIGAEKVGSLSNRFTVYKDPYFPRNKILVGYKGGSYLESGYVYAPYVPLIVTPTIFAPEDFTPRKGVMTRYGKKMVRADFFGTVTVLDLNII
jgi:hypothetical protein